MNNDGMARYATLMKEIKLRIDVISAFQTGRSHAVYVPTTVESTCLQIRKILELIAFGSLVANKDVYSKTYSNFAKTWKANLLLKDLSRINSNFYPRAIIEKPHGLESEFEDRKDALTQEEFENVYEKCNKIMHASNPFGSKIDLGYYEAQIPDWISRIMALLNTHTIRLLDDTRFYLVHMKEERDDEIHWYEFSQAASNST